MKRYHVLSLVVLMGIYLVFASGKKMVDGNTITVTSPNPVVFYQTGKMVSTGSACTNYYAGGWKVFISGIEVLPVAYKYINSVLTTAQRAPNIRLQQEPPMKFIKKN
jgi:hypothetical protein